MALNYCVNCGEKLEAGATHCAACGEAVPVLPNSEESTATIAGQASAAEHAEVDESSTFAQETSDYPASHEPEEDFSSFADFTGLDVMASDPGAAPAERIITPPDRTDVMAPIGGMRNASEYLAPQEKKSHLGTFVKAAFGLAAIVLVIAGLGLLTQPETQENIQQQLEAANSALNSSSSINDAEAPAGSSGTQEETESSALSSAGGSSLAIRDAAAYIDDDTAFEILTKTYDSLQSYNERVYSCLQTYNGVFVSSDRAQRETAAGIASSLLSEIENEMKSLDAMNIGRASSLYDDYQKVRRLLDDQYKRLAGVVESYDISLSYDAPYEHQNEILEPIRRDTGTSGQNKYLEDFDANYWDARPVRS